MEIYIKEPVTLHTANKYCKEDITIKVTGGSDGGSGGTDYMPYVKSITFSEAINEVTDDIYLDLPTATSLNGAFNFLNVSCNKITVKITNVFEVFNSAFRDNIDNLKEVEILGDTSNCSDFSRMFYNCKALETFKGDLDFSGCTTFMNSFVNCNKLTTFKPKAGTIKTTIQLNYSPLLSDESIQAIIDGLADLTETTAQTITLTDTVKAKLTEEQIASITSKNWTLA